MPQADSTEGHDNRDERLARLAVERNLFLWRTVVPLAVMVAVLLMMLGAPYSAGLYLTIAFPVYVAVFAMVAAASVRLARFIGYDTEIPLIIAAGFFTAGMFCLLFLLRQVRRQREGLAGGEDL